MKTHIQKFTKKAGPLRMTDWEQENIPLIVRLHTDVGNLPGGPSFLLPRNFALRLISRRQAVPISSFDAYADAELSVDDLKQIGFTDADVTEDDVQSQPEIELQGTATPSVAIG